jgi:hypothetical protein
MNEITIDDLRRPIDLNGLRTGDAFRKLGYRFRPQKNDFFRKDSNGRFHVKFSRQGVWLMHYDFFGLTGMHISNIPMTNHLDKERDRIKNYLHGKTN